MDISVIHEVWTDTVGAQLGLQWCCYSYPTPIHGYRFVWRGDDGRVYPDNEAPITRAALMFELFQKASEAGWFMTVENGVGSHRLKRAV